MVITRARLIRPVEVARTAWTGLRRFHNTAYVRDLLCERHNIPNRHRANALKQAEQIRLCLMQAQEYHESSRAVSLATRPVLSYYSLMSLAVAEILAKQTGDSSLDKAREQHRHHGLSFTVDRSVKNNDGIVTFASTSKLSARPAIREGNEKFGTFELWHKTSRGQPLCSDLQYSQGQRYLTRFDAFATEPDQRMSMGCGPISLLDCIKRLPCMSDFCILNGIDGEIIRASISRSRNLDSKSGHLRVAIHPCSEEKYNRLISNITVRPDCLEAVDFIDNVNHGTLTFQETEYTPLVMSFPPCQHITRDMALFWPESQPLNEFGYFYLSLYIAGNYARYYPDFWIKDIETRSSLANTIEELLQLSEDRVPLLALSELEQTAIVLDT